MKFIEPKVEYWEQGADMDAIWKHIARCVRVCYQSTPKNNNENDEQFVKRVILSHEPANSVANHLAMLEHGTIYLTIPKHLDEAYHYGFDRFSKVIEPTGGKVECITTNLRVIIERGYLDDLQWLSEPTWHERRYTFCFTTNIGVSREFNRHRVNSIAEESTRYCNYSKDKFGNEVTFVKPAWYNNFSDEQKESYKEMLQNAEDAYLALLDKWDERKPDRRFRTGFKGNPLTPQQAREVLPLATKTQLVHTAFGSDWQHFIALRSDGVSGKPHPNAKILADKVKEILEQ